MVEEQRVKLERIWSVSSREERLALGRNFGFQGKEASILRSTRRLAKGDRNISQERAKVIDELYLDSQLDNEITRAESREQYDVTNYFRDFLLKKGSIWDGTPPPIAFTQTYRITATVVTVYRETDIWLTQDFDMNIDGTSKTFAGLVRLLQSRINDLFKKNTSPPYETFGVALTPAGVDSLISAANNSRKVGNVVTAAGLGEPKVTIFSTLTQFGGKGNYDEVEYDED